MGIRFKNLLLLLLFIFMTNTSILAQSVTTNNHLQNNTDTIFNEIILSEDGVSAVDLDGNDWYFDFEKDMFVPGLLERSVTTRNESETNEPIELRCIVEKKVKLSSSNIIIDENEYVDHDIIVFGRVTVKGWVKGNIKSFNNKVIVKSTGQVDGDIVAPKIILHDNAVVVGKIYESSVEFSKIPPEFGSNGFAIIMIIMAILCVTIFLIMALLPKKLEVVSDCFDRYKVRSILLGILFLFFVLPLAIGLTSITIVGLVVVWVIPLAYVLAMIMGVAAFSKSLGNKIFGRFLSEGNKVIMKTSLGFLLFSIIWIVGITNFTAPEDSEMFGIGVFFFVLSILLSIIPIFGGIGAAFLTRFGYRPYESWKDRVTANPQILTPAPPPMPKGPEIKTPKSIKPKGPEIPPSSNSSDNT